MQQDCAKIMSIAKRNWPDGGPLPKRQDRDEVWIAFHIAECIRVASEFGDARLILDAIESDDPNVLATIERHRALIESKSIEPQNPDLITQFPEVRSRWRDRNLPSLLIRGWNFGSAMARWAQSGFKMRTAVEISERLAICQACPELVNDVCQKCGCACIEREQVMNKLALATEVCPLGKWS